MMRLWCPGLQLNVQPFPHDEKKKCVTQKETASTDQINCKHLQGGWGIWFRCISVIFFHGQTENSTEHPQLSLPFLLLSSKAWCCAWLIWSAKCGTTPLLWPAGRSCSVFLWSSTCHKACEPRNLPPAPQNYSLSHNYWASSKCLYSTL